MLATRAAAFRVLGVGEVCAALAFLVGLLAGNAHFLRQAVERGEFGESESKSVVVATIVIITTALLLFRDGLRRALEPATGSRSTAAVILLLATTLALNIGAPVERVARAENVVMSLRQQQAFRVLLETPTFAGPVVGFSAVPSTEYVAFRILSRSPYAASIFLELALRARAPGRLYALVALRRIDRAAYRSFVNLYAQSDEEVRTFSGCVAQREKVGDIVRARRAFEIRDGESSDSAFERRRNSGPLEFDIDHGGYSAMFYDSMGKGAEDTFRRAEETDELAPTVLD
jgi:hypothetical protein